MNPRLLLAYLIVGLIALISMPFDIVHKISAFIDRQFDAVDAHRESTTQKD